jgi:hypothetical protein
MIHRRAATALAQLLKKRRPKPHEIRRSLGGRGRAWGCGKRRSRLHSLPADRPEVSARSGNESASRETGRRHEGARQAWRALKSSPDRTNTVAIRAPGQSGEGVDAAGAVAQYDATWRRADRRLGRRDAAHGRRRAERGRRSGRAQKRWQAAVDADPTTSWATGGWCNWWKTAAVDEYQRGVVNLLTTASTSSQSPRSSAAPAELRQARGRNLHRSEPVGLGRLAAA